MTGFDLAIYTLKFIIPSAVTILFRAFGLGYRSRRRLAIGLVVFAAYMVLVLPALIAVMGYGQFTHVASLVMTVGAMPALIFSTDPPGKTILLILICAQMNSVVSVPLNMVRHLFGLSYLTLDILLLVVCPVVCLIALRFWAKPLRFVADNMHGRLTVPMLIPIVITAMIYAIPVYPAQNFASNPVYCTVMMMAVEFIFFLYIYTLYRRLWQISVLSEHKLDGELLRLSATSMAERLRLMDEAAHQSCLASHDQRHFNSMVLELLECGQQEEAVALLHRQTASIPIKDRRYCENTTVNAAAAYYASQAEGVGIEITMGLDIPNRLDLDPLELATAFSNLLENAIHGCEALESGRKRQIHVACRHVGRLALEITNPCAANTVLDEEGHPQVREAGHGVGTKSVIAFAAKYDGELFYRVENGVFTVRLLV